MSIGKKLYQGTAWNAISQFGTQAVNFVTVVILARVLSPKDFGLVGMVTVFTFFLGYFTEFGRWFKRRLFRLNHNNANFGINLADSGLADYLAG